jgi:hypothetical protein
VPSVARFREDYLLARLERAQIASLALLATDGMISEELERELLDNAEVLNVVLRRDAVRQLILSSDGMPAIAATYRPARPRRLGADARCLGPSRQPGGAGDPRDRPTGARCRASDRDHHADRTPADGDDRLRAAHSGAVGGHLDLHGAFALRRRAPPDGDADPAVGRCDDALCRSARGRDPHHPPRRAGCANCATPKTRCCRSRPT